MDNTSNKCTPTRQILMKSLAFCRFWIFKWVKMCTEKEWVFVYRHWCEENEMVFVSHEVPFPATSDRRSRVAGNGTEWEVKTIELSSSTSGGEQWAFLNFLILTTVKKTVPKLRKQNFPHWNLVFFTPISFSSLQNMSNAHFGLDAYCESRVSFGVIAKQAI